ncbi:Alpha-(1,6)-fucosyltransferase [Schistosoma haematobium]|uniref:Alpha-(1,6)-fucosyltransferase n=1 Tax=Schistosoma haematobium TaxID=6185 RepID=A0A922IK17_SCHHA|nr:Alpha-(1,6)-fucosyltransferase [Schistosoma haematobium]KAH9580669.1 Alpha-(1,6)-fucosyltransferase [Schistosoma haematobium]
MRSNGSLRRSIFRKQTWYGQLANFYSWVPLSRKRNLLHSLCYRIHQICSTECINEELAFLKKTLTENGYPKKFIEKNMNRSSYDKKSSCSVPKKNLYISLEFKGDRTSDITKNRLTTTIRRTLNAAKLRITFTSKNLFSVSIKDKLPRLVASMCIYQFTCSCGARYIGRSQRSLPTRIGEHIPAWFYKGERKAVRSSILEHLIDCNHSTDPKNEFKVVYMIRSNLPRFLRIQLLKIAEALTIQELKPELCVQKKYVLSLSLPWL